MYRNNLTFFVLLLILPCTLFSQQEASYWYFGNNAGLHFETNTTTGAVTVSAETNGQLNTIEGCATISDPNGNLLFYTDGSTVYNRNHQIMQNGTGLLGNATSTQSAIIVPFPGDCSRYYIFTIFGTLDYSVVDMNLDQGNGAVTTKNSRLATATDEKLTAVKVPNENAYWVIAQIDNTYFHAYKITSSGVSNPIISRINPRMGGDTRGYLKVSPNGKWLASANYDEGLFLFEFNDQTGVVDVNNIHLFDPPGTERSAYGVEFSSSSNLLYLLASNDNSPPSKIYQFDLTDSSPLTTGEVVHSSSKFARGGLQLGIDQKIYHALVTNYSSGYTHLGVINNPNLRGTACDYVIDGVSLGGKTSTQGLPPFIQSFFLNDIQLDNGPVDDTGNTSGGSISTGLIPVCMEDATVIRATYTYPLSNNEWQILNKNTGTLIAIYTDSLEQITHTFTEPGTYLIQLKAYNCGYEQGHIEEELIVNPIPELSTATLAQCATVDIYGVLSSGYIFDLTNAEPQLSANHASEDFSYYLSLSDAIQNKNLISSPESYASTLGNSTLYVRSTIPSSGCYTIDSLHLQLDHLNPGGDGTITICEGTPVTVEQLFESLQGNPDKGGTWTSNGTNSYLYTLSAGKTCKQDSTSIVTIIQVPKPYAGEDGTLSICKGTKLTNAMLYDALGFDPSIGSPDTGGLWWPTPNGAGTYTYTVQPTSPCELTDVATIVVKEIPKPNAGTDGTLALCEGSMLTTNLLFQQLGNNPDAGGTWSPALFGAGTYQYTVQPTAPCDLADTSEVVVSITPKPNPGKNGTLSICEGSLFTEADLFNSLTNNPDVGGTWSPALNSGAGTYFYTVKATSPCTNDSTSTVKIIETAKPYAGENATLNICEGTTVTENRLFQLLGTTDNSGTWSPAISASSGAGVYTYTIAPKTGSPCTESHSAQVTVKEILKPNPGEDATVTLCEGIVLSESDLFDLLQGRPTPGGTWQQNISTNIEIYTYTVLPDSNSPCTDAESAQITVTRTPKPNSGTDGQLTICTGTELTAEILFQQLGNNPDTGGTWQPSPSSKASTYYYTVAATSPCTKESTSKVSVTEIPKPNAGTDGTLSICQGTVLTPDMLFQQLGNNPDAGGTWLPALSGAGTYSYTVQPTAPCDEADISTVVVSVAPKPNPGKNGTLSICVNAQLTETELFGALTNNPDVGGTWSPALNSDTNTFFYTVKATSPCTRDTTSQVLVSRIPTPYAGADTTLNICEGETVSEYKLFQLLVTTDRTGTWSPTIPNNGVGAGTYTYTVQPKSSSPCTNSHSAQVIVTETPRPSAGEDVTVQACENESFTESDLFSLLQGSPTPGGTWQRTTFNNLEICVYTVAPDSSLPCSESVAATVTIVKTPQPYAGVSTTLDLCSNTTLSENMLLIALGNPDAGGTWSPAITASSGSGTYTYTVAPTSPCTTSASAFVTVSFTPSPDSGTSSTLYICKGYRVTESDLFNALEGEPTLGGTWSPALSDSSGAGIYTYTVSCQGESSSAEIVVIESTPPNAGVSGNTVEYCEGETIDQNALFVALGPNADQGGEWTSVLNSNTGGATYYYTVKAKAPCEEDARSSVIAKEIPRPYAGENTLVYTCVGTSITESFLFNKLEGNPDTGGTWSPEIPTSIEVGTYNFVYTVSPTLPCVGNAKATITLTVVPEPHAGVSGKTIKICEEESIDLNQLFLTLENADKGGTWTSTSNSTNTIYTYTVEATTPCQSNATAVVIVEKVPLPNAGGDNAFSICEGTEITEELLFSKLTGTPSTGGTWKLESSTNEAEIYSYTIAATSPCTEDAVARITVIKVAKPHAGVSGKTVKICEGRTVDLNQLFLALENADNGGIWTSAPTSDPTSTIYTYTVKATAPCQNDATATVILKEIPKPNAGIANTMNVCAGTNISEEFLFSNLLGNPDTGGTWQLESSSNGTHIYSYTVKANSPCVDDAVAIMTLTIVPKPYAGVGGKTVEICEGSTVDLNQLFLALDGADSGGTWSSIAGPTSTLYSYTVKATAPCQDDATATVIVKEVRIPNAGGNNDLRICEGTAISSDLLFGKLIGNPDIGGTWTPAIPTFVEPGIHNFTYVVKAKTPCANDAKATITLTVVPQSDAGESTTFNVCEGTALSENLFLSVLGTTQTDGTWSQPIPNYASPGTHTFTYSTTATSPCTEDAKATITLVVATKPNAGVNSSLNVCEGTILSEDFLLSSLGNPDTGGTWSPAIPTAIESGTYNFTYTVPATSPCTGDAKATVVLTVTAKPDAGKDTTIDVCEGTVLTESLLLEALGLGESNPRGSWTQSLPTSSAQGLTYNFTYTVTALSPCTDAAKATVIVNIINKPYAGEDAAFNMCEDNTLSESMLIDKLGNPDAGGTWSPAVPSSLSPGTHNFTYTVPATSPCTNDTKSVVSITVDPAPNAGKDTTLLICETTRLSENMLRDALGSPNLGGTWSPAIPTFVSRGTYNFTYTVPATLSCTSDAKATVTLTVIAPPDAGTDGKLEVCEKEALIESLLFGALGGNPDIGGTWSPAIPAVAEAGTFNFIYTVPATSPCASDAKAMVTLNVVPEPNAGTSSTITICETTTLTETMLLNALGNPDAGGTWSPSNSIPSSFNSGTYDFTYTVAATSPCTNDAKATVTIKVDPAPNAGRDSTLFLCRETILTEDLLFGALGGTPEKGGRWTPEVLSVSGAGNYTYTVEGRGTCDGIAQATITVSYIAPPQIKSNGDLEYCIGDPAPPLSVTTDGTHVLWYDNPELEGSPVAVGTSYTPNSPGTFYVQARNASSCTEMTTVSLIGFDKPIFSTTNNFFVCSRFVDFSPRITEILAGRRSLTINLYESLANAENDQNPISETNYALNKTEQTIFVKLTDTNTGCHTIGTFQVVWIDVIANEPATPLQECTNKEGYSSFYLTDKDAEIVGYQDLVTVSYYQQLEHAMEGTNPLAIPYQSNLKEQTVYARVQHLSATECFDVTELQLVSKESPALLNITHTSQNSIEIEASGEGLLYSLSNEHIFIGRQAENTFSDLKPGEYTLTVSSEIGCNSVTEIVRIVDFPKYFTPNGDGYNDTWHIKGQETYTEVLIAIFDRSGKKIAILDANSFGWDGTYIGNPLPADDYWFKATVTKSGETREYTGHFTLKR